MPHEARHESLVAILCEHIGTGRAVFLNESTPFFGFIVRVVYGPLIPRSPYYPELQIADVPCGDWIEEDVVQQSWNIPRKQV